MYQVPQKRPFKKLLYDRLKVAGCILASYLMPQNKKVRLLIFAQGRTGSTLLESLLCSTGYFSKQGEPLGIYQHVLSRPLDFLRGYAKLKKGENFICHTKIYHLVTPKKTYEDPERFVLTLQREGWKVIFLHRENIAKQVISSHIADQRKVWHRVKDSEDQFNHVLDLDKFEQEVEERQNFLLRENEIVSKIPHLALSYEHDLLNPERQQQTTARVLAFLGLDQKKSTTHLKKTTERKLSDVLTNYKEYRQLLLTRGWDKYLDDLPGLANSKPPRGQEEKK